jgi:hypothetical protein
MGGPSERQPRLRIGNVGQCPLRGCVVSAAAIAAGKSGFSTSGQPGIPKSGFAGSATTPAAGLAGTRIAVAGKSGFAGSATTPAGKPARLTGPAARFASASAGKSGFAGTSKSAAAIADTVAAFTGTRQPGFTRPGQPKSGQSISGRRQP